MSRSKTLAALAVLCVASTTLHAQQRGLIEAQRETMRAERSIALAWEAFAAHNNSYTPRDTQSAITSEGRGPGKELRWGRYIQLNVDYVRSLLEPTYIASLPRTDGWGNPLQFAVHLSNGISNEYVIRSLGADGVADSSGTYIPGPTTSPNDDIVYSSGEFVAYPTAPYRTITELNSLKPVDHVVALLEESGYKYSKVSENTWKFQFAAKSVHSLDVYIYYTQYLVAAFVNIGDRKSLKLDVDTLTTLLRYNNDIDAAKVALQNDDRVVYRIETPLRVIDEDQFRYMLTQVTRGADGLVSKLAPHIGRSTL